MNDVVLALRAFIRNPGVACVVVVTLAVAIATATVIASTIDGVWHFIPAARSDRLVFVASTDPRPGQSQAGSSDGVARTGVSIPDLVDWSELYTPTSWQPERSMAFVVRSAGSDPTQLAPMIRRELAQLDRNQPAYAVASMERVLIEDLGGTYLLTGMLAVIGGIALFLAAAGVYGLVSYSVSQRTREIGLRMALGARPLEILGMVVTRGSLPMAIGLVLGSVGAALLATFTSSAIEEIDLRDPIAYVVVSVPLVVIALFATYLPARRATHVDPLLALRAD